MENVANEDSGIGRCLTVMQQFAVQRSFSWRPFLCVVLVVGCAGEAPTEKDAKGSAATSTAESGGKPSAIPGVAPSLTLAPGVSNRALVGPLADAYRRVDPSQDGWQSEVVGSAVQSQLRQVGAWLTTGDLPNGVSWADLAHDDFRWTRLPRERTTVFQEGALTVQRGPPPTSQAGSRSEPTDGLGNLRSALERLSTLFRAGKANHAKFKVVRVEQTNDIRNDEASTVVYFHADGARASGGGSDASGDSDANGGSDASGDPDARGDGGGRLEVTQTWDCRWSLSDDRAPQLVRLAVQDSEVVELKGESRPLFADCTAAVLGDVAAYQEQLLYGTDYWRGRICRDLGLDVVANHGLAIADVNGDMLEDVYLCQQGGLPNRLFLRNSDGTLRDATAGSGADWLDYSASALLIDFDNNGTRDLIVSQETRVLLMSNDGRGRFELIGEIPTTAQVFSMSACDFDQDGDLDVYVCGYNPLRAKARTGAMGEPIPYHDAQNGGENMLLRNEGDWLISNVINDVGMGENNHRFSFAAAWEDYDNDGDFDIYVANDYGRNNLYRNDAGRFRDVAGALEVEDMSAGMSVVWADYNRDGWMDFYVSNMFSAAGNRITYQRQFKEGVADERTKQEYQRHARGNSLFFNTGTGFRDVSVASRTTMGRWAWGSRFVDINNDGWEDLAVANGFISTHDTGDL